MPVIGAPERQLIIVRELQTEESKSLTDICISTIKASEVINFFSLYLPSIQWMILLHKFAFILLHRMLASSKW